MTTNQNPTLNPKQVTSTVEDEQKGVLPVLPLTFIPINEYTTFRAEVAISEGDIIFHFYLTPEAEQRQQPAAKKYWLELFPAVLEPVAKEYFNADFPRLKAAYTEENGSWWMRAFGFGQVLDPHKLAYGFFDALDRALDGAIEKAT